MGKLPSSDPNKNQLRFISSRDADDWIIITNAPICIVAEIKRKCKEFLKDALFAELAEDKTLTTDIRKGPAHFLGFEIRTTNKSKFEKYTYIRKGTTTSIRGQTGKKVFALIDRKRMINRLFMLHERVL